MTEKIPLSVRGLSGSYPEVLPGKIIQFKPEDETRRAAAQLEKIRIGTEGTDEGTERTRG